MARIVSSGQFAGSSSGLAGPSETNRTGARPQIASIAALRSSVEANQMSPMPRPARSPAMLIKGLIWPQLDSLANRIRRPPFTSAAVPTWVLLDRSQPGDLHDAHGVWHQRAGIRWAPEGEHPFVQRALGARAVIGMDPTLTVGCFGCQARPFGTSKNLRISPK